MPEILVTGADGFVGRHLTARLRGLGTTVEEFSLSDGDIARDVLDFPGIRHVFHLAGRTYVPDSWETPQPFYETNVMGTVNVLEFCRHHACSITLISSYVYGEPEVLPISESHPVRAFNPYGHTKILAESVGAFYEEVHKVRVCIVRPFNLYGPGQDRRFLIPSIVEQALDPARASIELGDLRPRRDYLYIDDFIDLLIATWSKQARGIFNAGSGTSVSVGEVAETVAAAVGVSKPVVSNRPMRSQDVMDVVADIGKARRELQWEPAWTWRKGIESVVSTALWGVR